MREDTIDYTIYSANVKRKRPTPRKGSRSAAKKRVAYNEDDDDDEEDDDRGWNGGGRGGGGATARRLNYSTRSSNRR